MCFSLRKTPFVPTEYLPAEKIAELSLGGMVIRVAYLKRNVAGAMEDVAEDWSQSSPHLSSVEPGHQMLGAEEEKESNIT